MYKWYKEVTPSNKVHKNIAAEKRRKRNVHLEPRSPKRQSFKKFWRKHQVRLSAYSRETSRKQRRELAMFLYHNV